ncbi:peptidase S8/S53 domain-containing protein, partial [Lasiosphaeris hirsuta]
APRGQARISHRKTAATSFIYEDPPAITIYAIDTGIMESHWQFSSPSGGPPRAVWGANFVNNITEDEMGHGTHVAGTMVGRTLGVAPEARVVALKIFDAESGSWTGVLSAIEFAVLDAESRNATSRSVINMSIGGGFYSTVNDAVTAATDRGVTVVVAAGNENQDAADTSPASCPDAITVGAINGFDQRAAWSNWGPTLDVFAPGDDILSAWPGESGNETTSLSGTSMASPHVSGLVAYLMQVHGPHTPAQMKQRIENFATQDMVQDAGEGSPNRIAFNGNGDQLSQN